MLHALKKVAPTWFTPASQEKEEKPTRFMIRPLTPPERESVMEMGVMQFVIHPGRYADVIRMGVSGWENMLDENNEPLEYKSSEHWRIPGDIRIDLALEILNRSRIEDEETKN